MPGKVTFIFDDGLASAFEVAYPLFRERGVSGCIALFADLGKNKVTLTQALAMQEAGWEVMSHSASHSRMDDTLPPEVAEKEILTSKRMLTEAGFAVRQFVTPMSACHEKWRDLLYRAYDAAYTVYTNSSQVPVQDLVIPRPMRHYELHRASLSGKTLAQLCDYIDYVAQRDEWMVFYDHEIGVGKNVTAETLAELLDYIASKGVRVVTGSQAVDECRCKTRVIRSGYDKEKCLVHARCCMEPSGEFFATAQYLNVKGSDLFTPLLFSRSGQNGRVFPPFLPDDAFTPIPEDGGARILGCDATPLFHRATGKILVLGHTVRYREDSLHPVAGRRKTFYAVFDREKNMFSRMRFLETPGREDFFSAGNGSGQSAELPDGELLIPVYHKKDAETPQYMSAVLRCRFDGETLHCLDCGNSLAVENEPRGVYEPSVILFEGKYYMTLRSDLFGYYAKSDDGLHYSAPSLWKWDDGETLPNCNTQQHWMICGGRLYLVYTRRAGTNDHVFRHRAPLFAARVRTEDMCLVRKSEFIAVPERGARLGNFGVFAAPEGGAFIMAAEWMQPEGCESHGSDNAIYLTEIRPGCCTACVTKGDRICCL